MSTKYEKINYQILGRFQNGNKFGIATKQDVSGYTPVGCPEIAIRKRNGFWYVDHVLTGLGIVTTGCKTRDAALDEYVLHYLSMMASFSDDRMKNAVETFENAPLESDVEKWELVNFCTTSNHRFDKITAAASRAGLITKKADGNTYLDGGNINIIGDPDALERIRDMISKWERRDAERAEIISSDPEDLEAPKENAAEMIEAGAGAVEQERQPEDPERDPKKARGPIPEKSFIGETIRGAGWLVLFDKAVNRTRIIFDKAPEGAVLEALENAGFYYSKAMGSWNKKLTFKAYRAAQKLAAELNRIQAA